MRDFFIEKTVAYQDALRSFSCPELSQISKKRRLVPRHDFKIFNVDLSHVQ